MIHRTAAVLVLVYAIASSSATAQSTPADTIPLRYEEKLVALGFPSPLLRATVSGQSVWFLIDTGASVHTLASWLVNAAHLSTRETTATVTGSTGTGKPVRAIANQATLLEGGRRLELREAIVVEFPANFAENRIGGLLSPQLLATGSDASVLDLRVPALRFEAFDSAVTKLNRERPISSAGLHVCLNARSPFENRLYTVPVTADAIAGTMLVDTGATATLAAPSSSIADGLKGKASERTKARGVGGNAQVMSKAPGVKLEYGGASSTLAVTIGGAAPPCEADGLIGMDALRRCVLVLGESAFAWSCDAE